MFHPKIKFLFLLVFFGLFINNSFADATKNPNINLFAEKTASKKLGDAAFDLALGKEALAAGKFDVAVLTFDRLLIIDPTNAGARFGLAEAYYGLNLYNRAKEEIDYFKKTPPNKSLDTSNLMAKINKGIAAQNRSFTLYGDMVFGYDTNPAATTDDDFSQLFLLISGQSIQNYDDRQFIDEATGELDNPTPSYYLNPSVGASGKYSSPNSKYDYIYWDFNLSQKEYLRPQAKEYNIGQANITIGFSHLLPKSYLLTGNIYFQEYLYGGERYRESPIAALSFGKIINANHLVQLYINDGAFIYPENSYSNVYIYTQGFEWAYSGNKNTLVSQVYYGIYRPMGGTFAYYGENCYGINITAQRKLTSKLDFKINGTYEKDLYEDKEFANSDRRKDGYGKITAGFYYQFHPMFAAYVTGSYYNNNSNLFIYKYDRFEVLTGIGFNFVD